MRSHWSLMRCNCCPRCCWPWPNLSIFWFTRSMGFSFISTPILLAQLLAIIVFRLRFEEYANRLLSSLDYACVGFLGIIVIVSSSHWYYLAITSHHYGCLAHLCWYFYQSYSYACFTDYHPLYPYSCYWIYLPALYLTPWPQWSFPSTASWFCSSWS